ncbi:hypothetical protein ED176_13730 [Enterococcus faecium]|nr:hypothetical protein [Enterococcus faecium]EGP5187222.1 hypothetical protein [Enterococcus faecium]EGP5278813.1 hypothetical protein [Enterococcus faecium]EGP5572337.1 hypothetical protein [Enterococcus faecium]PCE11266.1 hypothetical protein CKY17_12525 [Enterococcus faecium]
MIAHIPRKSSRFSRFFLFAVDYLVKIRFTFIYRMNHVHRRMNIKGGDDKMQNVSYLKESGIFR